MQTRSILMLLIAFVAVITIWYMASGSLGVASDAERNKADNYAELLQAVTETQNRVETIASKLARNSAAIKRLERASKPQKPTAQSSKPNPYAAPFSKQEQTEYEACLNDPRGQKMDWDGFLTPAGKRGLIRWDHPMLKAGVNAIEVGGNIGLDLEFLYTHYHNNFYVFEPIPRLCGILKQKFARAISIGEIHIFCQGLAGETRNVTFMLSQDENDDQDGAGEFDPRGNARPVEVSLVAYDEAIEAAGLTDDEIHMLNINCEGCEFELLENLLETGRAQHYPEIQLSWHPLFDSIQDLIPRRCRIKQLLARTHRTWYSFHLCWESWLRNDLTMPPSTVQLPPP